LLRTNFSLFFHACHPQQYVVGGGSSFIFIWRQWHVPKLELEPHRRWKRYYNKLWISSFVQNKVCAPRRVHEIAQTQTPTIYLKSFNPRCNTTIFMHAASKCSSHFHLQGQSS
jgi:hypothetical protein